MKAVNSNRDDPGRGMQKNSPSGLGKIELEERNPSISNALYLRLTHIPEGLGNSDCFLKFYEFDSPDITSETKNVECRDSCQ